MFLVQMSRAVPWQKFQLFWWWPRAVLSSACSTAACRKTNASHFQSQYEFLGKSRKEQRKQTDPRYLSPLLPVFLHDSSKNQERSLLVLFIQKSYNQKRRQNIKTGFKRKIYSSLLHFDNYLTKWLGRGRRTQILNIDYCRQVPPFCF